MKHRLLGKRFFLVASILTAVLIFFFSAQDSKESSELSDGITVQVAPIVRPDFAELPAPEQQSFLASLSHVVRKCAHFLEFALLGFNLTAFLRLCDLSAPWRACQLRAWGLATLYAVTDELHQLFVDQRAGRALDVLIDSSGALMGVLVATLALSLWLCRASRTQSA